jgi:hypothetical protein
MKYQFIPKPSNILDYAVFPFISHPLREFARAPVRLQVGDARWGSLHIERVHAQELRKARMSVAEFVASIVKPGSPIFCEFESMKASQRTQTINVRIGTVILEYKPQGFYTVITAFSRTSPIGELIGRLE